MRKELEKKSWKEFQSTGLVFYINQVLHVFGWCICFEIIKETGRIIDCYPARTTYRGFDEGSVMTGYQEVNEYMKNNANELYEESKIDDNVDL